MTLIKSQEAFKDFSREVIFEAQRQLDFKKINASGSLNKSLGGGIEVSKNSITINFTGNKYGEYVEAGRGSTRSGGSGTVKDSIMEWLKVKRIKLRDLKTGRFIPQTEQAYRSAAYLIARKIHREGFKATRFMENSINRKFKLLEPSLAEKYGVDVASVLQNQFNKNDGTNSIN